MPIFLPARTSPLAIARQFVYYIHSLSAVSPQEDLGPVSVSRLKTNSAFFRGQFGYGTFVQPFSLKDTA